VSGTGIRIAYSIMESIRWSARTCLLPLRGNYPGTGVIIPRFFVLHVLIVPATHRRAAGRTWASWVKQKHTQFPGKGKTEDNVVGSPCSDVHGQDPPASCS